MLIPFHEKGVKVSRDIKTKICISGKYKIVICTYMPNHNTKNDPIFLIISDVDSISPKRCKGSKSIKKLYFAYLINIKYVTCNYIYAQPQYKKNQM
jgi:hypothetical protein